MNRFRSTYLAALAVLLSPIVANAVPVAYDFTFDIGATQDPAACWEKTKVLERSGLPAEQRT